MISAGIDGGSRAIKVALYCSEHNAILGTGACDQGVDAPGRARQLYRQVLAQAGVGEEEVAGLVATGYTRNRIDLGTRTITEITCHAAGVRHLVPEARTVIEIGGQDSKVLKLGDDGTVEDFAMNDRCAAGTGRFLEMVADKLESSLGDLGQMARVSGAPAVISSMCVVFAESEIIGLLAEGKDREDIVAGVQQAMARRIAAQAGRTLTPPILFTGGVARVTGMVEALATALGQRVRICPRPEMTGAIGAALLGADAPRTIC